MVELDRLLFTANASDPETPAITYQWDFGDGVVVQGQQVGHAYTRSGNYLVTVRGTGLDGLAGKTQFRVAVNVTIPTKFEPANIHRALPIID